MPRRNSGTQGISWTISIFLMMTDRCTLISDDCRISCDPPSQKAREKGRVANYRSNSEAPAKRMSEYEAPASRVSGSGALSDRVQLAHWQALGFSCRQENPSQSLMFG